MRRETIGSSSHAAKMGSMSRSVTRKVDHSTIFPTADIDAGNNDSPKGVPIVQAYGFSYWPKSQEQDQQQGGGQQSGSGSDGGSGGAGAFGNDDQPKGKGAIGLTSYANGSRSDPSLQNLQDPRHHLMLENPKQQDGQGGGGGGGGGSGGQSGGGQDYGGREGDTAMYHMADKAIQMHFAGGDKDDQGRQGPQPGAYLTTREDKNRIRMQLVKMDDQQQQGGQSGGGQSGGGGQQQQEGQHPLLTKPSGKFLEVNGPAITGTHDSLVTHNSGDAYSAQRVGSDSTVWYTSRAENSCQATDGHAHIVGQSVHIWVAGGCFSDMPIIVKKDGLCKN